MASGHSPATEKAAAGIKQHESSLVSAMRSLPNRYARLRKRLDESRRDIIGNQWQEWGSESIMRGYSTRFAVRELINRLT